MRIVITEKHIGDWVAAYIAKKILEAKPTKEKPFVLGLPTGETPIPVYKKLIEFYRDGLISFENIVTFNMDEYVGISPEDIQSYHYYMNEHFFNHINIKKENINILNGLAINLEKECEEYEKKITKLGGIDLFIGGVGVDGHIAFNEPGSSLSSRTRKIKLTKETVLSNARFFNNNIEKVPKYALTVGVGTILDAKEILIMIKGSNKARAFSHGVEQGVNHMWTISALQLHKNGMIVSDENACSEIKVGTYKYFKDIEKENLDSEKIIKELYKKFLIGDKK